MATIAEELASVLEQLPERDQERVLSFARYLAAPIEFPHTPLPPIHPHEFPHTPLPPGTPGYVLAQFRVSPEVGEAMQQALEDGERIWPDEW